MIRSIRILFYREDRCFWPAMFSRSPVLKYRSMIYFPLPWHVPSVWIPHPKLPSVSSLSFFEALRKPASVRGNGPSTTCDRETDTCRLSHAWSHIKSYVWVWKVLIGRMWQFWHPSPLWLQWCFPSVLFSPCLSELYRVHPVEADFIDAYIWADILFEEYPFLRMGKLVPAHVTVQMITVLTRKKFTVYSKERA